MYLSIRIFESFYLGIADARVTNLSRNNLEHSMVCSNVHLSRRGTTITYSKEDDQNLHKFCSRLGFRFFFHRLVAEKNFYEKIFRVIALVKM